MNFLELAKVKVPACGIFAEPTFKSEMVNQVLEGEEVKVMDKKGRWLQVSLVFDGYEGWIHEMYLDNINVSDDYLKEINIEEFYDFPIIKAACKMLGKPYIWGGRSYQGYDCSGLVQTTMNSLGFDFPRDAKKQAESKLLYEVSIEDVAEQDFLFFEENGAVSHVAICMSQNINSQNNLEYMFYMIHSSGMVKFSNVIFDKLLNACIDGKKDNEIKLHKAMRLRN